MFDGMIMVGIGVFITLIGYRKIDIVRSRAGFSAEAWYAKHGHHMRLIGPFLIVVGIGLSAWGTYAERRASPATATDPSTDMPSSAPTPPREPATSPEATARRARSEARLKAEGIPVNPDLPVTVSSDHVRIRSQDDVVDRTFALSIVAVKGEGLEQEHVYRAIKKFGAATFFSQRERAFIADPEPSQQDRTQFVWRYECVGVMLWALGFDAELASPVGIVDAAHVAGVPVQLGAVKFREQAKLRSVNELLDEADLIYRYNWACVDARVNGRKLEAIDCDVVVERHHALNWLIGYQGQAWDDVSTDT